MKPPKVFISYSWKPIENKQKVLLLAERLSSDFVHVILDDWDLKEGHDKYQFMERMINDAEVIKVLIICNKDYAEKANSKKGGVGIESMILSDEIYRHADQTKFVPVVFEFDQEGKQCVPTFVHSRIFIDLSANEIFEENYEKLLRCIFNKPLSKRPPLGTMPAFLLSDEPIYLPTAHKVATIKNALINEKKNCVLYIKDYLSTFVSSLPLFSIKGADINQSNYDELILAKIEELKTLRDDFINFIDVYTSNSVEVDAEILHSFFEKLLEYLENCTDGSYTSDSIGAIQQDNFKFFYYELFLTFSSIMFLNERFNEMAIILQTPFIINKKGSNKAKHFMFSKFRQYARSLNDYHNRKLNLGRTSVTADMICKRATKNYDFDLLKETDLFLHYLSLLYMEDKTDKLSVWFPETSCYNTWENTRIRFLTKTVSERYFNKLRTLFVVSNKNELIVKLDDIVKAGNKGFFDMNSYVADIKDGLEVEKMCTMK